MIDPLDMPLNQIKLVRLPSGAIYAITHDMKRYVPDPEWMQREGYDSLAIAEVPDPIDQFKNGPNLPSFASLSSDNGQNLRLILSAQLRGQGIEIGAGARPMLVPIHCKIIYVDAFEPLDPRQRSFPLEKNSNYFMPNDIKGCFEDLSNIHDETQDFAIASHVIEHSSNPLKGLTEIMRILKPGGVAILIVPDMRYTFDNGRELTTLEHLLEDYAFPSRNRDLSHYQEFRMITLQDPEWLANASRDCDEGVDLHYHTFTSMSFREILDWLGNIQNISTSAILQFADSPFEFAVTITKNY